jgi:hypothetical protein
MDLNGVGDRALVSFDLMLLHRRNADIMNGHERDSMFMRLFQILVSFDHFTTRIVKFYNLSNFVDIIAFLKQGKNPMWRIFSKWKLLDYVFFHFFSDNIIEYLLLILWLFNLNVLDLILDYFTGVHIAYRNHLILFLFFRFLFNIKIV